MEIISILKIKSSFAPILQKAGVNRSSIFGSYARGEQNSNSDIDLLIDFPENKGLIEFVRLKNELEDSLNRKVDLVTYNSVSPLIREQIFSDQIVLI